MKINFVIPSTVLGGGVRAVSYTHLFDINTVNALMEKIYKSI